MLGLSIANRTVAAESAADRVAERAGDKKLAVVLKAINEKIPTHAVIFDVSTDRGIRSGNQTLTEIMYGLFLQSLGYAKDLDLSELEIGLEEQGRLARFGEEYRKLFKKEWDAEKGKVAFALSEASRVLHSLDPDTYPMADSWVKAVKNKADITAGKLADLRKRLGELTLPKLLRGGRLTLVFVVLGAGSAATGIAERISLAMAGEGVDIATARSRNALFDINGLVVASRTDLADVQKPFAKDQTSVSTFVGAVRALRPTGIIGVSRRS